MKLPNNDSGSYHVNKDPGENKQTFWPTVVFIAIVVAILFVVFF